MNLKKLVLQLGALVVFVLLTFGATNAQTFFVNNLTGNDANAGNAAGAPKLTVASAIIAAPNGSTIQVQATGVNYTEADITINKPLTFTSVGGTPVFVNASLDVQAATTFSGPFHFQDLTLTAGAVTGASNLLIEGDVTRVAGSVSGQLNFTAGVHDFYYNNAAAVTTGGELPATGDVEHFGNLTTTIAKVTLNGAKTVNGTITTANELNLGGFTLTIVGANNHVVDGPVANGTVAFSLTGDASINGITGDENLPTVTVNAAAGTPTLTIAPGPAGMGNVGDLTVSGSANVVSNNTGTIGNVINSGTQVVALANGSNIGNLTLSGADPAAINTNNGGSVGNILLSGTTTVGISVLNNGTAGTITANANTVGTITLDAIGPYTNGSMTQSGKGFIQYGAGVTAVTVNGYVTLNTAYTLPAGAAPAPAAVGPLAYITFPDVPTTVTGAVNNLASVNLNGNNQAANTSIGVIAFLAADNDVTLTSVTNNSASTGSFGAGGALDNAGNILFSYTGVTATSDFGATVVANNSTINSVVTNAGNIKFVNATNANGQITFTTLTNSSATVTSGASTGMIDFNAAGAALITVASVTSNGAAGGDIQFGVGNVVVNGNITSTRSAAGADILWGAGTAARTVTAQNIINSGASNIDITVTTNGAVNFGKLEVTGTGKVRWPNVTTAAFTFDGFTLTNGEVLIAGTSNILIGDDEPVVLTGGTLDLGALARNITFSTSDVTIGGALTNPTFVGALTTMRFDEAIPNVTQVIKIGGANPVIPYQFRIINGANIPAPIVKLVPAAGSGTANLYVLNDVRINTAAVLNSVLLDGVRLNIGKNGIGGGNGNFQNTTGYTTANGGYIMMSGTSVAQAVNFAGPSTAGATFGAFGVDNESGLNPAVTFANPATFTAEFYLAEGFVDNVNVNFDGVAPWPTIYRTEGEFVNYPTIALGTMVNVTYYGSDKLTSFEVPAGATELFDLTVATTNGATSGKGIVTLNPAVTTVNGVLTINADQTLYTGAKTLVIAGAGIVNNGYLVDDGTTRVQLAAATGTALAGPGKYPGLQVNAGSVGNTITNIPGIYSNGLGDGVWGGAADNFTAADASINFAGGAASSLTAAFTGAGPHFADLTLANNGTFTLGANAVMSGNLAVPAGTVALADYTLDVQGLTPGMTGGAAITSNAAGKLLFQTGAPVFTVTAPAATIAANFEYKADGGTSFTLNNAGADLKISGNITLTDKSAAAGGATFTIGAGRTLTAAGANVTVGTNCAFAGTGILLLDVDAPNTLLTYSTPSNTNVANLTINDNVALTSGGTLVVGTAFVQGGGDLNIGSTNLQLDGTFTRTAGTYSGSGWMIWNSAGAFTHGPAMAINKFQINTNLTLLSATTFTVNENLYLNNAVFTQTNGAPMTARLVLDGVDIRVTSAGNISNAGGQLVPTFVGLSNYSFDGNNSTPNLFTWPAAQANNVTLNMNAGQTVTLAASRTINGDVTLTEGTLVWDSPAVVTLAKDGAVVTRDNGGALDNDGNGTGAVGTLTAANVNLVYTNAVGNTGLEYSAPVVVTNFTLGLPAGSSVTIAQARSVAGTLTMNSTLTVGANTTFALAQTIPGASIVNVNAGVTVNWNGGLTVNGLYTDAATSITNVTGNLAGIGTITINGAAVVSNAVTGTFNLVLNGTLTANSYAQTTGATTMNAGSVLTLTADGTINNLTVPVVGGGYAALTTSGSLAFTGTYTGVNLNLTFTGAVPQTVALGGSKSINNLIMNKTSDQTVTVTGGNITLNPVSSAPAQVAGLLTLTRGVLVIGDIAANNPAILTVQLTAAGGFITNLGYVRNPVGLNLAHVQGKLGVAIPAGTIGRSEWPVGASVYRPASITFTPGNGLIAPTTIIVEHLEGTPAGEKLLPLDGGVKFDNPAEQNWIGEKAPYAWRVLATTSLGASQLFDIELQGTNLGSPVENVNDLRIIRRFDGNVEQNGWFLQGNAANYSNILQENIPAPGDIQVTLRNRNSIGGIVTQAALFTVGVPVDLPTAFNVSGQVTYNNTLNTALEGVTVTLTPGGATTTTDAAGNYTFANVENGTYNVTASSAAVWPAVAVNATDAQRVAQHYAGISALAGLPLVAADVNNNAAVNNTDALQIIRRWAGLVTSFAKGDWTFNSTSVTVNGAAVANVNLKGIAVGDAKADWNGTIAKASTTSLTVDGLLKVNPKEVFEVPVTVGSDMNIGAMSLRFTYPADMVTFESVTSKANGIVTSNKDGVVSIGWADVEALNLKANAPVVTLKFKPTENFKVGSKFDITLDASSELANQNGEVISSAMLKSASVEAFVPAEFALKQNYPNPFNPSTTIAYDLPVDSKVSLVVFNAIGQEVATLVNEIQTAGVYKYDFNASRLTSGVYYYRINVSAGEKNFTQTQKMVLMK